MIIRKKIELNIADSAPPPRVTAVQGDSGREYEFVLIGNGRITVPNTASAQIYVVKPSGAKIYNACTIVDGNVVAKTTTQMLAEVGNISAQLEIIDGDVVKSFPFLIEVKKSIVDNTAPESTNEFTALTELLAQSNAALADTLQATDDANEAAEDATAATGLCITATTNANTAKDAANTAASNANTKATAANNAATAANTAAGAANTAATNANNAYVNYQNNNAASADKLKTARNINGQPFDGQSDISMFAVCATAEATAAKTVSVSNFALVTGSLVTVLFTNGNTNAASTLNVAGTGEKAINAGGVAIGIIGTAQVLTLVYTGTAWEVVGYFERDTGWITMPLTSAFANYGSNAARYRKIGNKVILEGDISPVALIAASTVPTVFFTLPAEFLPSTAKYALFGGSTVNQWKLTVYAGGGVGVSSYGAATNIDIPTSARLQFYFEFAID